MVDSINFEPYLRSLIEHYAQWREFYTSTEASQLTVQVVQSEEEEQPPELQKEIERLYVLEGIRKYAATHVLLSGRPGSGKSTALRRLLLQEAEQSLQEFPTIPVLVELRSGKPILKLIESTFRRHRLRISAEQIEELLFEGKLLLLLDGVNEIPTDELLVQVEEFRSDNLLTPMIFTTRDLDMGSDLRIEKRLMMEPLNSVQMRQFVGKYLPSEQGKSLLQKLGDRLKELGETPLLLKMLCDVFELKQEIPKSKGELFRWVDQEYDRLKGMTTLAPELRHWQTELLQRLAFEMMKGNNLTRLDLTILRTDAIAIFEAFLQEHGVTDFGQKARVWLEDLQKYHLLQRSADQKIEFHHQLFQEYYAAEYLLQQLSSLSDVALQREYLNYLKWTEPLALMLGLVEDEGQALRVVELAIGVDLMLGARLAGAVKQEFQRRSVKLVEGLEDVHDHLKIKLMGETRSEEAIKFLTTMLQSNDPSVRMNAAEALGKLGSELGISFLKQILKDEDFWTRMIVSGILWDMGKERPISSLLQTEESQCIDFYVHRSAPEELKKLGYEETISSLLQALQNEDSYVRAISAYALVEIGSKASIPALLQALQDEAFLVRKSAVYALGELGSEVAIPALLQALQDEAFLVRKSVAEILGKFDIPETLMALWQKYRVTAQWEMRSAIASIQARCQFYNYEIYQSPPELEAMPCPSVQPTPPKYDIKAEVVQIIEHNDGEIIGKRDHKAV